VTSVAAAVASPQTDVLGVEIFAGTFSGAVDTVVERARSGHGGYVVQCNVHVLMTAHDDPELMRALHDAWLVMPDGAPIAWLQRRLGAATAERVGGPDLMPSVIDRGRRHGLRHFFVGSTPETLQALVTGLEACFPGVELVGAHSPQFGTPAELAGAAEVAAAAAPNVVWLALGAPKQELWMHKHAMSLAPAVVIGVGAAFDFQAGAKARAPQWARRGGLEWAHRLTREPRRLTGRYVRTNSAFVLRSGACLARRHGLM
jgi:N-acetylglucosaminyldiphosphoundecaprenol N-acetyl-beta-D-mannosaminyltransferase